MGLDDRAQHVPDATDERGEAVKTPSVSVVGQMSCICPVGQVKITKSLGAMLDHHVVAVVGQRAIDVIDARDRVQESDRISDAILEIETVNVRLECLSEVIDLLELRLMSELQQCDSSGCICQDSHRTGRGR